MSKTTNTEENGDRPVLVPAGNKTSMTSPLKKIVSKSPQKVGKMDVSKERVIISPQASSSAKVQTVLRRQEKLLHSNLSLNASCSSDCSRDSSGSRASTGRIGSRARLSSRKKQSLPRPEAILSNIDKIMPNGIVNSSAELAQGARRCSWVTPYTDPCHAAFHDEEWGMPVHDDKKLFELLVFSGALAELTWPAILSKRRTFREVFCDFDPVALSKLNEKKITAKGNPAITLLSESKVCAVIENARQILKIVEEFGSFDRYCWSFVNHKPIVSKFRHSRHVPVKTPKADVISKDMVRRGFRSVGPTVIYSFMQAAGITNDHVTSCYRFEECCTPRITVQPLPFIEDHHLPSIAKIAPLRDSDIDLEFAKSVEDLSIAPGTFDR